MQVPMAKAKQPSDTTLGKEVLGKAVETLSTILIDRGREKNGNGLHEEVMNTICSMRILGDIRNNKRINLGGGTKEVRSMRVSNRIPDPQTEEEEVLLSQLRIQYLVCFSLVVSPEYYLGGSPTQIRMVRI